MTQSDSSILARIAAGDLESFGEFYDQYAPRVWGLLVRILGKTSDAEDVLQEVFWQVWKRAAHYDPERATPLAWLFMIARSRALDLLRRKSLPSASTTDIDPSIELNPADSLEQHEQHLGIQEALARLPEDQRSAIQLAFYNGLTHEQVAERQQVPLGTAKTRIRLGIQRLRQILQKREGTSAT